MGTLINIIGVIVIGVIGYWIFTQIKKYYGNRN
jgi:uncharacterized membrane protein YqgA involved in biofilm formation